jgi:hypothetical protein
LIINLGVEAWQRRLYGPRLELHCEAHDHRTPIDWLDENNKKIGEVIYVRMRVRNVKPRIAKSCRAYLTKVERLKPDGRTWETRSSARVSSLLGLGKVQDTVSMPLASQRVSINSLMSWRWESCYRSRRPPRALISYQLFLSPNGQSVSMTISRMVGSKCAFEGPCDPGGCVIVETQANRRARGCLRSWASMRRLARATREQRFRRVQFTSLQGAEAFTSHGLADLGG